MTATQHRGINHFNPLVAFTDWWVQQPFSVPPSIADGVHKAGAFTGITLYRSGQFQVQLWLCPPNTEIPDHAHPNVDIIQFYVSGQVYLRLNGKPVIAPENLSESENGLSSKNGFSIHVGPSDTHGASIGQQGGAFITVQQWLNRPAQSVEMDWSGDPLDEEHAIALRRVPSHTFQEAKSQLRHGNTLSTMDFEGSITKASRLNQDALVSQTNGIGMP